MNSSSQLSFAGLTVVVTGAGRGLGRQYALDFAAAGADVVAHARRKEAADEVVEHIRSNGGSAAPVVADARDGAQIIEGALAAFGRVDALVVNAGITRDRTFARMSADEWADVLDTHIGGAYTACAAVWPHMLERGSGAIVLTTSGAGAHGNVGQANYAAAKAALIGFTKTLALEGGRKGIAVNAVAPMAHTPMTDGVFNEDLREGLPAEAVSPFVLAMAHPSFGRNGAVVETGGGWAAEMRWERSAGRRFTGDELTAGTVLAEWDDIARFDEDATYPASTGDCLSAALGRPL